MKSIMIATAACVLCAGCPTVSMAEDVKAAVDQQTAASTLADLERRVGQLEAKIGGETVKSAFQPRNQKVRHPSGSTQTSNLN
jgi:hypothetical protein